MKYKVFSSVVLLLVLSYVVVKALGVEDMQRLFTEIPLPLVLFLCGITFLIAMLKSWRFFLLLQLLKLDMSFPDACKVYIAGQATSFLPGGEMVRGMLLAREANVPIKKVSSPIFLQAYVELLLAAVFMVFGSILFETLLVPSAIILSGLLIVGLVLFSQKALSICTTLLSKIKKGRQYATKLEHLQRILVQSSEENKKQLLHIIFLGMGSHILGGFACFSILLYYHESLGVLKSIFIYSSSVVIQGLSITPGGIGLTEGGMTGVLLLSHVALAKALAVVLVFRMVTLGFNTVLGAIAFMYFYSKTLLFEKVLVHYGK